MIRALVVATLLLASSGYSFAQFGPPADFERQIREQRERMEKMQREMQERMKELGGRPLGPAGFPGGRPGASTRPSSPQPQQPQGPAISIAPGDVQYSKGESLLVRDQDGKPVVGRHHVTIGNTKMVMMPDGEIKTFEAAKTQPTSKRFVPMSMDEIEKKLLSDPKLRGFKTIRSRRFLYVYNCSELFIRSTRTILESMYPAVRKYFGRSGIDVHEPELPMVLIAFSTDEQFQEYRRMPQGIVAYYDGLSNNVFLYEKSRLSEHAPEIAVKNAISTIAHEGAHQILHNIGVQQRLSRWPMWLSEGLAEFYAPTSVQKGVKWSGIGSANDLRMMEISKDLQAATARRAGGLGTGQRIQAITATDSLDSKGYAYSWALIHMLARRHQKELFKCIRQCSELRPFDGTKLVKTPVPTSTEVFEEHFGSKYPDVESELLRHLKSLNYVDPMKSQTHYIVISGLQVTMTSSPEKVKELQKFGRARVQTYPNREAAERAMKAMTR